jgi:hypothetical protein
MARHKAVTYFFIAVPLVVVIAETRAAYHRVAPQRIIAARFDSSQLEKIKT